MTFITGLLIFKRQQDEPQAWALGLACFMGISISAIIHNHLRLSMWRGRWLNILNDSWFVVNDVLGVALFALGATLSHKGPVFRYLRELWSTRRRHFWYSRRSQAYWSSATFSTSAPTKSTRSITLATSPVGA